MSPYFPVKNVSFLTDPVNNGFYYSAHQDLTTPFSKCGSRDIKYVGNRKIAQAYCQHQSNIAEIYETCLSMHWKVDIK